MYKIEVILPGRPGSKRITPSWSAIQHVIRTAYSGEIEDRAEDGVLTSISRDDASPNYRDPGSYTLTFDPKDGNEPFQIALLVR